MDLRVGGVDPVDVELPVSGEDRARERELVADLEAQLACASESPIIAPARSAIQRGLVLGRDDDLVVDRRRSVSGSTAMVAKNCSGRRGSLPPNQLAQVRLLSPAPPRIVVDVALRQRHDEGHFVARGRGGPSRRTRRRTFHDAEDGPQHDEREDRDRSAEHRQRSCATGCGRTLRRPMLTRFIAARPCRAADARWRARRPPDRA